MSKECHFYNRKLVKHNLFPSHIGLEIKNNCIQLPGIERFKFIAKEGAQQIMPHKASCQSLASAVAVKEC